MLASAFAEDASDMFLRGYQEATVASRLESEDKPADALERYRNAAKIFQKIAADSPDWQPLVLEYRLKKTRESITRLEAQVGNGSSSSDTSIEGPLPSSDRAVPEITSEPLTVIAPTRQTTRQQTPSRSVDQTRYDSGLGNSSTASEVRTLRRQIAQLQEENDKLTDKLQKKGADLQSAMVEIDRIKVTVVDLKSQLAQANSALEDASRDQSSDGAAKKNYEARISQYAQKLAEVQADNEVLTEENTRLLGKLDLAAKYIASSDSIREGLLKERVTLADARDTALAKLKKIKDNAAELDKVADENKTLKARIAELDGGTAGKKALEKVKAEKADLEAKLAESDKKLQELSGAGAERDKTVLALQSELNSVNDKLLEAQSQLTKNQDQVADLQKQLDETSGDLAKLRINGAPNRDQQTLLAENDILRGIILRQIKEQPTREEAKKKLEQEIAALQIQSSTINEQLGVLGAPTLHLTPEEKSVFKEPMALLSEPNAQAMDVTLAISKEEQPNVAATSQGPESLPDAAREQVKKAKQFFDAKNYLEAEKVYQAIVDETPDNYFALSNLGAVQIEAGKLSAAEVALKKAIEINPGDAFAYTNLGIAYSRQGKFDEAISNLKKALEINGSDAVAHNYLGVCLGQKDDHVAAEQELRRAIELKPDYPDAHFNLAVLYATLQPPSLDLAKMHYNKATSLGAPPDSSLERLIQ